MSHDAMQAMEQGMFWVGAMFVFMPILFASIVIGVWWYQRKSGRRHAWRGGDSGDASGVSDND
jgi:hypothetical protein